MTQKEIRLDRVLPVAACALAAAYLLFHFDLSPVLGDEGITAAAAWRIASGEVPGRDYFDLIPPAAPSLLSLAFLALGPSVLTVRLAGMVYGLALILGVFFLARSRAGHPLARALPVALLIPFGVGVWPFPSHHWLADILLVLALLCLGTLQEALSFSRSFGAGLLLGLACLTLQDQGGYALLGTICLYLPLLPRAARARASAALSAGLASAFLPAALWLIPRAGFSSLWRDWVLFPFESYHGGEGNAVSLAQGIRQILSQWDHQALKVAPVYSTLIALDSWLVYALPLVAVAVFVSAWRRRWFPRADLALLGSFTAAFVGAAWHRWSLMNLIWAAPMPMLWLAIGLDRALGSERRWLRRSAVAVCLLILTSFMAFGILRIRVVQKTPLHPVTAPAGSYRLFNPHQARDLQEFVDVIGRRVPEGAPAFCRGYIPLVSFLTLHPNPTRYTFLLTPGYNSPSQVKEWAASIERQSVEWGFGSRVPLDPRDPADAFLIEGYKVVWENRSYVLWRKRGAEARAGDATP